MVKSRLQDPRVWFCLFAVLLATAGCGRRGRDKAAKRGAGARADGGVTARSALAGSVPNPTVAYLPEFPDLGEKKAQRAAF